MIKRLQKRFIAISASVICAVFALIFIIAYTVNASSVNRTLDSLTDMLSENDGRFPEISDNAPPMNPFPGGANSPDFFNKETPFSTRFFTVWFNDKDEIVATNTMSISSVTEEEAEEYAKDVVKHGEERGWKGDYRYKIYDTKAGYSVVFVDGSMYRGMTNSFIYTIGLILIATATVVLLLIVLISKRAMKPIAESYEKQKQFITDANHELKTPLTLIMTNLDILESQIGENEWVDGIRLKGAQMTDLVGQLVTLSRMDEDEQVMSASRMALSECVLDSVAEFLPLAEAAGKRMESDIQADISYMGNEESIRRVIAILLDNAVKYCDKDGDIRVTLKQRRQIVLTVENTYSAVCGVELGRLFDRFYRSDKARTFGSGFGVGLSIAQSIVKKHRGDIIAYKKDDTHIGFKVTLKP